MIIKGGSIFYLFDFDGTLFGEERYVNYLQSWSSAFNKGPYINPNRYDVRWSILTARPKIDLPLLWSRCWLTGLYPEIILTSTWKYPFKSTKEKHEWKRKTLIDILNGKNERINKLRSVPITKVIYVDNDLDTMTFLNSTKGQVPYLCLGVTDFVKGGYEIYL
jgi:hypothetical protein